VEMGGGNHLFDIVDRDAGSSRRPRMIEVLVERSKGASAGAEGRLDTVIGDVSHRRGMTCRRSQGVVARSRSGGEHDVRLPFEDEFPSTTFLPARRSLTVSPGSSVYTRPPVWLASYSRQRNEAKRARSVSTVLDLVCRR